MTPDDILDPHRLARESIYSVEAWRVALDSCRGIIPDPALIRLVEGGAGPWFLANLPKVMACAPIGRYGVDVRRDRCA